MLVSNTITVTLTPSHPHPPKPLIRKELEQYYFLFCEVHTIKLFYFVAGTSASKVIRSLTYLYGKHNYARNGCNVVNGLVDPQLGLYLPITDISPRGFLGRRTRIRTAFASKFH